MEERQREREGGREGGREESSNDRCLQKKPRYLLPLWTFL